MNPVNKKGFQLTEINPMKLEVHELAGNNPMMPEEQYIEFVKQFVDGFNRNISHVVLYKGKVVDGRHRTRACKELGITLWARNLPGTMSLDEVEEFVEGTENRRHQTPTQRAIGAYKYYVQKHLEGTPVSQAVAATRKLSNRMLLARAGTLTTLVGTELINKLHNGEKLMIKNLQTGKPVATDALITLINYFTNRNAELVVETKVNRDLTDAELELANSKFNELQVECNALVLKQISTLIYNVVKGED